MLAETYSIWDGQTIGGGEMRAMRKASYVFGGWMQAWGWGSISGILSSVPLSSLQPEQLPTPTPTSTSGPWLHSGESTKPC